jgi:uncharacterized protein YegP (UPF0339 family)
MARRGKYEICEAREDELKLPYFYWRLKAGNGEIVAQSEGYTRHEDAYRGAKDCQKAARFASIEEKP